MFICLCEETLDLLDTELKIENALRNVTCSLKEEDDVMPTLLYCAASLPEQSHTNFVVLPPTCPPLPPFSFLF